jgi:hypothetical protein
MTSIKLTKYQNNLESNYFKYKHTSFTLLAKIFGLQAITACPVDYGLLSCGTCTAAVMPTTVYWYTALK